MKYKKLSFLLVSTALLATSEVTTLSEVFSEAQVHGNVKYYYIQTDKDFATQTDTSAHANSVGGQLSLKTASLYGVSAGVTFMTTNPFLLPTNVDTSIIGKDNGVRGGDATNGFSVLGEAYLNYKYAGFDLLLGREVIKTPLANAKEVRMLPSSFEGAFLSYKLNTQSKFGFAYLSRFKQRTSDVFTDMVEHALGSDTQAVTGYSSGSVSMLDYHYTRERTSLKVYDYYADDFLNSLYIDMSHTMSLAKTKLNVSAQYIHQNSIGNADTNLAQVGSVTGGNQISVNAYGLKASTNIEDASFLLAFTKVLKDDAKHDSLVLPWDGTPLFTDMITSNNLFQSNYGKSLQADGNYIGGSQGIKLAYHQKFDSFGLKGVSTNFAYLHTSNGKFLKNQHDYNVVLAYKHDKSFSLALKGIWVQNNTSADKTGTISQLKLLSQYRVIANYKF